MNRKNTYFLGLIVLLGIIFSSCGPQRKNFIAKTYHNTTSLFNWYYNGEIVWKEGVDDINDNFRVPPEGFIPILYYGDESSTSSFGNFDEAIKKAETIIFKHPNGKWIDNSRYLIGRSWFYKRNYLTAAQNFEHIIDKYPDSKLVPKSYIWLAKTFYMNNRESQAQTLLDKEIAELKLKKRQKGDMAMLQASIKMDSEDYIEARSVLTKNYKNVKGKLNKARVNFLLGQLYANENKFAKAYDYFRRVTRMNTDYELIFNAKIQTVRLLIDKQEGADETNKIRRILKKMIRDEKNEDYNDRLYYELAMLDLKQNDEPAAIDNLEQSVRTNTNNQRQLAVSYYNLGKIYFYNQNEFTMAQAYFDSASTVVTKDAPEYEEIKMISKTLQEYVDLRNTIHYEDSMIRLAGLSEQELDAHIDFVIDQEKLKKAQALNEGMGESRFNDPMNVQARNNRGNNRGGSGFYFDNPELVSNGRVEFQRLWGNRKIEDNWRRKNKRSVVTEEEEVEVTAADSSLLEEFGDKWIYYKDIPKTEEEIALANTKIVSAMFQLGQVFDQKLNQPDSAIKIFNQLIRRYPNEDDYVLKSKFSLYRIYSKVDPYLAEEYADEICGDYPNSIYCKIIKKEDIGPELAKQDMDFKSAYTALYTTFKEEDYNTTVNFGNFIFSKYPEREEIPQVLYMKGMAFGKMGNVDSLIKTYKYIYKNHKDSEVYPIVRRALRMLKDKDSPEVAEDTGKKEDEKVEEVAKVDPAEEDPRYKGFNNEPKPNEKFFVVLLIDKEAISSSQLKVKITNFNRNNFSSEKLAASIFFYKRVQHLAYISQFTTAELAVNYLNGLVDDPEVKGLFKKENDKAIFITPTNFKTAYGKKRFEDYVVYYENVILPSLE